MMFVIFIVGCCFLWVGFWNGTNEKKKLIKQIIQYANSTKKDPQNESRWEEKQIEIGYNSNIIIDIRAVLIL